MESGVCWKSLCNLLALPSPHPEHLPNQQQQQQQQDGARKKVARSKLYTQSILNRFISQGVWLLIFHLSWNTFFNFVCVCCIVVRWSEIVDVDTEFDPYFFSSRCWFAWFHQCGGWYSFVHFIRTRSSHPSDAITETMHLVETSDNPYPPAILHLLT